LTARRQRLFDIFDRASGDPGSAGAANAGAASENRRQPDRFGEFEQGALDQDGKFLALRVATSANLGAYLSSFAPAIPTYCYGTLLAGTYTTPAVYVEVKGVFTNTVPVDAYRGAGRPEACYVVERLVDTAAREMGIDPAELRRRNFIPKDAYPYQTPVALTYDSGDYFTTLEMVLKTADYPGFEQRRQESAQQGKLRGIGIATYIEACAMAPSSLAGQLGARAGFYETAGVRVHPTGSITVLTGTHSHGQGHETTFAQVVADQLGVPIELVDVVHGDTNKIPFGMGTYASRSLAVGGSALVKAIDKVVSKGKKIAAHLLEASEADLEFKNGQFTVAGTDRSVPFAQVALTAYVPHNYPIDTVEPGLDETAFTTQRTSPTPPARTSRRSKSIEILGWSHCSISPLQTISGASSTRSSWRARCTVALSRA
jgi:carbon-monoxide dehydrogenase large subunit